MARRVSYRQYSDSAAQNYERYFVPAIGTPLASGLLEAARLEPAERVLDVACGTGVVTRLAAERVAPEVGRFVPIVFSVDDPDEVGQLRREAGFRDVDAQRTVATLQLPPPADFLWPYVHLTPMSPSVRSRACRTTPPWSPTRSR